ncbi:membrane protein [Allocatelliglobosispora scoriae]|uniref:Membrane protein n=1 Tax=Allocatelliglobosispora scoriae TaxID=643052 RepID=A0A841C311_9ACTN|nr:YihY/virulence factor BrkB family protein [Allocatelliglobosispora scoriae]MBB5873432.1 membrane protein [Allocatelliglobosispora scoriae]
MSSHAQPTSEQAPPPEAGPASPARLSGHDWWSAIVMTVKEFRRDNLTVWAAALTYYSVLSLFPGLLVLVAILGLLDDSLTQSLVDNVIPIVPASARDIVTAAVENVQHGQGKAGLAAVIGLLVATWSASGYVAGFMQASNAIYDVKEGRPVWKTVPIRIGVTLVTGVLLVASMLIVVLSGELAQRVGDVFGIGPAAVDTWNVLKWPVLVVIIGLLFAILYWACPNVRQGGFAWVSPGGLVAVVLWVAISLLFALYTAHFGSYDATYGTLGGVIVFLTWLWLSNVAILFGAEFDAELERRRAIAAGHPADQEPYMQMRDGSKVDPGVDEDLS